MEKDLHENNIAQFLLWIVDSTPLWGPAGLIKTQPVFSLVKVHTYAIINSSHSP